MNGKRLLLVVVTTASIVVPSLAAHAASPSASCPRAFQGPLTFAQIIEEYPPPPEITDPEALLVRIDRNNDKLLCVQDLPSQTGAFNAIDNVAQT